MLDMPIGALALVALVGVGIVAGGLNAVVGSGSLIAFPALIALGVSPLAATLTGSVGLAVSNFSGPWGYRVMLFQQGERLRQFVPVALIGGLAGSLLLTVLPAAVFDTLAPILIVIAVVLVIAQPWLQRRVGGHPMTLATVPALPHGRARVVTVGLMFLASVYGGYFVAAQGVFMFAIIGILLGGDLRYVNALKNALATLITLVAAIIYVVVASDRIVWPFAGAIAVGAGVGGILGARVGRVIPGTVLRWLLAAVGIVGVVALLVD